MPLHRLLRRLHTAFVCRYHRIAFNAVYSRTLDSCTIGLSNRFQVPVRSDGKGGLSMGNHNSFGYLPGPCLGSGEILLQPRDPHSRISIGDDNRFSNNVAIISRTSVSIGNFCLIGDQAMIVDADFHSLDPLQRRSSPGDSTPTTIADNVWIGSRVVVLKGVTIGSNSVIGAMSLVTRSIPANSLAFGVPARVIRSLISSTQ